MKKVLALILAALISVTAFALPVYAYADHVNDGDTLVFSGATEDNAFGDLLDWTGIVFGNANNIIAVEGTLAVGGEFTSARGISVNGGANGAYPASTDDVAFLVGGNAIINGYGNIWGQTVLGKADGNTYRMTNVTASDTTNGQYTVADSRQYFADAQATAYAAKAAVEALPVNGTVEFADGVYTFVGDPSADVLVYELAGSDFSSYRFDFTIADGQTIVLNLTSADKITMSYGAVRINNELMDLDYLRGYNRNIIVNVANATEIEMFHTDLYGILIAPDAALTGTYSDLCGTAILNGLTGLDGFNIQVGGNSSFIPTIPSTPDPSTPDPDEEGEKVSIRIDTPLKMAVAFEDGTVCYGGEMKEFVYGQEYLFQMCSVNWENGLFDDESNGIRGTVVYRMKVVHRNEFNELARAAKEDPERYTVKGIDIIDNVNKTIIVNGDASDSHLETDVNNFFVAYRFHFTGADYNKKTGIDRVVNNPLESLSVNLPAGSTITCNAFIGEDKVDSVDLFVETNSGEGEYDNVYLTSVNDYTWGE